jgi:AraC-like DNA-binding protein
MSMLTAPGARAVSEASSEGEPAVESGLQGTLCVWPDGILFIGENVRSEPHRHFTASLFFALSGCLRVRAGAEREWRETRGALIAPNVRQEMDARGCRLVVLQIDPETDAYARVVSRLLFGPVHWLPDAVVDTLSAHVCDMFRDPDWSPARLWDTALELVGGGPRTRDHFDPRIEHVLARLKREILSPPTAADLARDTGLSEGRLLHLFSDELGVPLRRYLLWLRLRQVIHAWALTRSLTESAHAAGFADSAHLSRTFRSMYGIRPSDVLRGDGRVELLVGFPSYGLQGPHASSDGQLWASAAAALDRRGRALAAGEGHRWLPLGVRCGRLRQRVA